MRHADRFKFISIAAINNARILSLQIYCKDMHLLILSHRLQH